MKDTLELLKGIGYWVIGGSVMWAIATGGTPEAEGYEVPEPTFAKCAIESLAKEVRCTDLTTQNK